MTDLSPQTILVTGGAGYIGSHTCVELLEAGFDVVVIDNFDNSSLEALNRVEQLTQKYITTYEADIRDRIALQQIFTKHSIDAVIHFAGLKAIGESVEQPLKYFDNNVHGSIVLFEEMQRADCNTVIFSSSAVVYGEPLQVPIEENAPAGNTSNPYGRSKWMVEEILRDLHKSDSDWKIALLRCFTPVGAHKSGQIGEDPEGTANNLMTYIAQIANGKRDKLQVFGDDYPTTDGSGIRDYIHVVDLAKGHVKALEFLFDRPQSECVTLNLGTGNGVSVMDMVKAFEEASGKEIPFEITERRHGDVARRYASPVHAKQILNWHAELDLHQMCEDVWRWQSKNPDGYTREQLNEEDSTES